jgi:putative PIN family toxin of toxin-antitoxin system
VIRAVIDTNVYVSGIGGLNRLDSSPGEVDRRWRRGEFVLIASPALVDAVSRTLSDRYFTERVSVSDRALAIEGMQRYSDQVFLPTVVERAATQPEDDLVLATAVQSQADMIVTGDKQLLKLAAFHGIPIIRVGAFLSLLSEDRD